jgi:hypothetical protein
MNLLRKDNSTLLMHGVPVLLKGGTSRTADRDGILQRLEQRASSVERP